MCIYFFTYEPTRMINNSIFSLILLFSNVIAQDYAAEIRVVGGYEAPNSYGLSHVSLQNLSGHHVCGGAVISSHHVVTAAHCIYGVNPLYVKAVVGTTNLDVGGKQYDVTSINIHKNYNATLRSNDIAVIKVKGPLDLNTVEILKLHEKELSEGDELILTGFGAQEKIVIFASDDAARVYYETTLSFWHNIGSDEINRILPTQLDLVEKPNGASSRIMHMLHLPVFNQETCRFAMRYTRKVFDSMFCTFTRIGEGSCHGDSGGPLMKDNQLVGLVSWGIPCAVGFPDVHTRITPYIGWIREQIM